MLSFTQPQLSGEKEKEEEEGCWDHKNPRAAVVKYHYPIPRIERRLPIGLHLKISSSQGQSLLILLPSHTLMLFPQWVR